MGYGRHATHNSEFQDLLREDAVDVLRPNLTQSGMTQARKAAALAETYYVALCPYHRGGPHRRRRCDPSGGVATELVHHRDALLAPRRRPAPCGARSPADGRNARTKAGSRCPKGTASALDVDEEALRQYALEG